jgi:ubiquinone/menaquinone biosynthesis C-methylase UbiE
MAEKNTSWGAVADWYDELLEDSADSFQKNVIMPNLIRLVGPKKGMTILDVACGQGYFSRAFAENGASVIGCDISSELIDKAKEKSSTIKVRAATIGIPAQGKSVIKMAEKKTAIIPFGSPQFHVAPSDKLSFISDSSADVSVIVLALQNIENLSGTLSECSRVLKSDGRLFIVLNHPAFRIPQSSSWQWDEKTAKQFRRVDSYMSDKTLEIDMTPGEKDPSKKKSTISFHRPLQSYFKALNKSGFAITRFEEWISHKKSQKGPRATEEDRMRKEIPMFVCLEALKR